MQGSPPAVAVPVHVGRRTIVLQTSIYRADGKLAAMMIQTQMVLPEREWWQPASAAVTLKVDRRCIGAASKNS